MNNMNNLTSDAETFLVAVTENVLLMTRLWSGT